MSEVDFYAAQSGQFRGTRYPGFTGGTVDAQGNVVPTPVATNVSQSSGQNLSPEQVQASEVLRGDAAAKTGSSRLSEQNIPSPSMGESAPSNAAQLTEAVLPTALSKAGETFGAGVGQALEGGASLGSSIGEGFSAVGDKISGLFGDGASTAGGLLGSASGSGASTVAGSAPMSIMGSAGPMSTAGASETAGTLASEGASLGSSIGGAATMGLGTFIGSLLTGNSLSKAAVSGVGAGFGAYAGGAAAAAMGATAGSWAGPIGMGIGALIGSMLGNLVGNKTPHPGGTAVIRYTDDGKLYRTGVYGKHIDQNALARYTDDAVNQINDIMEKNNLMVKTPKDYKGELGFSIGTGQYSTDKNKSASDLWQELVSNGWLVSKTPSSTPTLLPAVQSSSAENAPVSTLNNQYLTA